MIRALVEVQNWCWQTSTLECLRLRLSANPIESHGETVSPHHVMVHVSANQWRVSTWKPDFFLNKIILLKVQWKFWIRTCMILTRAPMNSPTKERFKYSVSRASKMTPNQGSTDRQIKFPWSESRPVRGWPNFLGLRGPTFQSVDPCS